MDTDLLVFKEQLVEKHISLENLWYQMVGSAFEIWRTFKHRSDDNPPTIKPFEKYKKQLEDAARAWGIVPIEFCLEDIFNLYA